MQQLLFRRCITALRTPLRPSVPGSLPLSSLLPPALTAAALDAGRAFFAPTLLLRQFTPSSLARVSLSLPVSRVVPHGRPKSLLKVLRPSLHHLLYTLLALFLIDWPPLGRILPARHRMPRPCMMSHAHAIHHGGCVPVELYGLSYLLFPREGGLSRSIHGVLSAALPSGRS